jgi:hypothetical protein
VHLKTSSRFSSENPVKVCTDSVLGVDVFEKLIYRFWRELGYDVIPATVWLGVYKNKNVWG